MSALPLSLCMIVKNEAEDIEECLDSARPFVKEIIVVDTGSTDQTKSLAEAAGAKVLSHNWNDDFSEARNVSLENATQPWILVLDADERLVAESMEGLKDLLGQSDVSGIEVTIENINDEGPDQSFRIVRIFRNKELIVFDGTIHENVLESLLEYGRKYGKRIVGSNVRIVHHGYQSERIRRKGERNLKLLRKELQSNPDDLYLRMKAYEELEKLERRQDCDDLIEETFKILFKLTREQIKSYPFSPVIIANFAQTRINRGAPAEALAAVEWGSKMYPGEPWMLYYEALARMGVGQLNEAEQLFNHCLKLDIEPAEYHIEPGIASWLTIYQLGMLALTRKEPKRAVTLLERSIDINNQNVDAYRALVEANLQARDYPAAVKVCMDILAIDAEDLWALVNGARILHALKMNDRAREWAQKALAVRPDLPEAQQILQQINAASSA